MKPKIQVIASKSQTNLIHGSTYRICLSRYAKSRLRISYHQNNILTLIPYVVFLHKEHMKLLAKNV